MITEDYVSFETAKLLKEKGFNGLCTTYYDCFTTDNFHCGYEPTDFNSIDTKIRNIVAAPTLQMAMKWLRKVHKIDMWVECHNSNRRYKGYIHSEQRGDEALFYEDSYEEACEAAIKHCLENLI